MRSQAPIDRPRAGGLRVLWASAAPSYLPAAHLLRFRIRYIQLTHTFPRVAERHANCRTFTFGDLLARDIRDENSLTSQNSSSLRGQFCSCRAKIAATHLECKNESPSIAVDLLRLREMGDRLLGGAGASKGKVIARTIVSEVRAPMTRAAIPDPSFAVGRGQRRWHHPQTPCPEALVGCHSELNVRSVLRRQMEVSNGPA